MPSDAGESLSFSSLFSLSLSRYFPSHSYSHIMHLQPYRAQGITIALEDASILSTLLFHVSHPLFLHTHDSLPLAHDADSSRVCIESVRFSFDLWRGARRGRIGVCGRIRGRKWGEERGLRGRGVVVVVVVVVQM